MLNVEESAVRPSATESTASERVTLLCAVVWNEAPAGDESWLEIEDVTAERSSS